MSVSVLLVGGGLLLVLWSLPLPTTRLDLAFARQPVSLTERLGRRLRAEAGLAPADATADRRWGRTVGVSVLVVVQPGVAIVAILALWIQPVLAHRRTTRSVDVAVWRSVPEVANVMSLAVRSGATIEQAIGLVGDRVPGIGGTTFTTAAAQLRSGALMLDVLDAIDETLGEPVRPLCRAVVSAMQGGTELVPALDRVADELRRHHHQRQLQHAHRVPVALLFPLVLCTLPAFALLTVVPLIATSVGQLTG